MKFHKAVYGLAALGVSVCLLAACATKEPPANLLKDAQDALSGADNAEECATQTYLLAQKALHEAKTAAEAGDDEKARQKARLAATLAKQAKEEAVLNAEDCERRRNTQAAVAEKLDDSAYDPNVNVPSSNYHFEVIYFDFDEAGLSSIATDKLATNVNILKSNPSVRVSLAAHTDERGTTEYNIALSQKRGESVKQYVTTMGVDGNRLSVVPYGKEMPASFGSREQDYALNRRVEFVER